MVCRCRRILGEVVNFNLNINSIKQQAEAMWLLPFELYKELVTVYKTPTQVFVSSSNPTFNFAYGADSPGVDLSYVTQSGQIYATIDFVDQEDNNQFKFANSNSHNVVSEQKVKMCFNSGDFHYFQNCEKVVIDNRNFRILSDYQNRGAISARSQTIIFLTPIE